MMNRFVIFVFVVAGMLVFSCNDKEDEEELDYFNLLTSPVWVSDSLLADGVDASGSGGILEPFKGEAKFNADNTGTFGSYSGTWSFVNKTQISINTVEFPFPIVANIVELTQASLKITTVVPDINNEPDVFNIRMTFKAK